ncbi:MAG: hypothetical protein LQ345_005243 [Seirophora villosa]|nr:MAG: hypothetical protein LQ345_005243 [Seirophora villosa]
MFSLSSPPVIAILTIIFTVAALVPPPSRPIDPSAEILLPTPSQPYRPVRIDGIEYLQSIALPHFGITTVWNHTATPTWLRRVDPDAAVLLLNLAISTYATRPSDSVAGYGTLGPESNARLASEDTRLIVKQWVLTNASRGGVPAAPMRNKEIAYAAQIARWLYQMPWFPKREYGWKMCNLSPDVGGVDNRLANCTGVLLVQRDLWIADE